MNKRMLLLVGLILILLTAIYFFSNTPKTSTPQPIASEIPSLTKEDISVELSLKTLDSATSEAMLIDLPSGSDHCEVLKKAQEQGKITGLDMRYQEEYKTNGVFVINGVGKTDSPWWVYKINGADAPAGCSQIKVAQGDKILWEYIGE